jgi:AcrR family transcriptional regulator
MKLREQQLALTRTTILDALAAEITENGLVDLSIQAVADRAGVTHRTVYNHFPTREALNDAFAEHVEILLAKQAVEPANTDVDSWPQIALEAQDVFNLRPEHLRAYVMMTIAMGTPASVFRNRSKRMAKALQDELGLDPATAKLVVSAVRMFMSSAGWFLMNAHHGLTSADAGRVSAWAIKTLIDAARNGNVPLPTTKETKDG